MRLYTLKLCGINAMDYGLVLLLKICKMNFSIINENSI